MSAIPARQFIAVLQRHVLQDLSASWIAVSALYFLNFPLLPEPMVALAVGTIVGLSSAVIKSIGFSRMTGAESSDSAALPQGRRPDDTLFAPTPVPAASSRWTETQRRPQTYPHPGSSNVLGPQGSMHAPRAGRLDPTDERTGAHGPSTYAAQAGPSRPGTAHPVLVPAVGGGLDFDAYSSAQETEVQCPHCGSFAVTVDASTGAAVDDTCAHRWTLPSDGSPPPDVVIRSWFSP